MEKEKDKLYNFNKTRNKKYTFIKQGIKTVSYKTNIVFFFFKKSHLIFTIVTYCKKSQGKEKEWISKI